MFFAEAGLNWKEERQKWIDANCNGTTPCKLGDATTNINLRNAYCDGTWPPKKDVAQTPEQIEACKTKCAAVPLQAGQTLSPDHAALLRETVAKLEPVAQAAPANIGIMAKDGKIEFCILALAK